MGVAIETPTYSAEHAITVSGGKTGWELLSRHRKLGPAMKACVKHSKQPGVCP